MPAPSVMGAAAADDTVAAAGCTMCPGAGPPCMSPWKAYGMDAWPAPMLAGGSMYDPDASIPPGDPMAG